MAILRPFRFESGEVVVYNDRADEGYIRPNRSVSGEVLVYYDRRSFRDPKTQVQVGTRVLFKANYRDSPPVAKDLCLEPSVTEELAKLPDAVTGKVVHVNEEKHYGFIQVSPRVRAWFSFAALAQPNLIPLEGDRVSCNITQAPDGRLQANNVVILDPVEQITDSDHDETGRSVAGLQQAQQHRDNDSGGIAGESMFGWEFLRLAQRCTREGDDIRAQQYYEQGVRETPNGQLILS